MMRMLLAPLPDTEGGGDVYLVRLDVFGKPTCIDHGAMNKVSPDGIWRCITTTSATAGKRCNAGAFETGREYLPDPFCVCNVGVQHCLVHPGRLLTQEERIAFRKAWDARVALP